jgi:hypothetical protein
MPSPRGLTLLVLALLLTSCKDRALQQRAEQIREFSNKEDRAYITEAFNHIEHNYWSVRGRSWFGKLPDGTIVRLESPHPTIAPLPSAAFYLGWHLQLTLSADNWSTYPPTPHTRSFAVVYAITRHSATSWDIRVSNGAITAPPHREDAVRLHLADQPDF